MWTCQCPRRLGQNKTLKLYACLHTTLCYKGSDPELNTSFCYKSVTPQAFYLILLPLCDTTPHCHASINARTHTLTHTHSHTHTHKHTNAQTHTHTYTHMHTHTCTHTHTITHTHTHSHTHIIYSKTTLLLRALLLQALLLVSIIISRSVCTMRQAEGSELSHVACWYFENRQAHRTQGTPTHPQPLFKSHLSVPQALSLCKRCRNHKAVHPASGPTCAICRGCHK